MRKNENEYSGGCGEGGGTDWEIALIRRMSNGGRIVVVELKMYIKAIERVPERAHLFDMLVGGEREGLPESEDFWHSDGTVDVLR